MRVLAVIPVAADVGRSDLIVRDIAGASALARTVAHICEDLPEATVVVASDDDAVLDQARTLPTAPIVLERKQRGYVECLNEVLDSQRLSFELVVTVEATHPFRPKQLLRRMVTNLASRTSFDSIICVRGFDGHLWQADRKGAIASLDEDRLSSQYFEEVTGLGSVTRPAMWRTGRRRGDHIGFEVVDPIWSMVDLKSDTMLLAAQGLAAVLGGHEP